MDVDKYSVNQALEGEALIMAGRGSLNLCSVEVRDFLDTPCKVHAQFHDTPRKHFHNSEKK